MPNIKKTSIPKAIIHALPEKRISNDDLLLRFSDDIVPYLKLTGIQNRSVVAEGQCASDLAFVAVKKLFEVTDIEPESIDLLTFCTSTPDYRMPATACILQDRLGLPKHCCTMDILHASPAFVHNMAVVHGMLVSGTAQRALAINADAVTQLIHPHDHSLAVVHGDGAVAVVMEAQAVTEGGIEWFEFGTDGSQWQHLSLCGGMGREPYPFDPLLQEHSSSHDETKASPYYLKMDGTEIFHFAVHKIPVFINETLRKHGCDIGDYDLVLLHQANRLIVDMIYMILKVPQTSRFYYLENVGNLSSASLPATFSEAFAQGKIRPGSRTLLCGFGAGLSWGAFSIQWPQELSVHTLGEIVASWPII